jgi:hypothetical protein
MKPWLFFCRATLASLLSVQAHAADSPVAPTSGSRVRIWSAAVKEPTIGSVVALQDDSITVTRDGDGVPVTVLLPTIRQLDLSTGRHRRPGKGAWVGALVGFVALGLVFAAAPGETDCAPTALCAGYVGLVLGVPVGAVVGTVVGSTMQSERWNKVPLPLQGPATRSSDRFAVAIRLSF